MSGTITGIVLSNATIATDAPAGSEVGIITVTMSDGSPFTGTLTLGGPYAQSFVITATRNPYAIAAVSLDNFTVPSGAAIGTKVGTITVTLSDGAAFAGTISVDDVAHFSLTGVDLFTAAALTSGQTYPVTVTATDPASTNQSLSASFQITVQVPAQVPGPLTSLTSPVQTTSSIQVAWSPPTTGGALDAGVHQIQYKAAASGTYLNAPSVPYCTATHGSFTDGFGNVWSINAANHPVVNSTVDAASNVTILYLVGGTIWQLDTLGSWHGTTPTGTITGLPSWSQTSATSPLALTIAGLAAGSAYNVRGYATNIAGNGAPSTAINISTQAVSQGGVGPVASNAFLTVDFQVAQNYPSGGLSGQAVLSQRAWGASGGTIGDNNFQLMGEPTQRAAAGQVNLGMLFFKNSNQQYFNSDRSVNTAVVAPLVNNWPQWDPLGIGSCAIGIDFDQCAPANSPTNYATCMANLVTYLSNFTMSNGKKFPLFLITGQDEPPGPSGVWTEPACTSYYNAFIPAVRAANPNIMIAGPTRAFRDWNDFPSTVGDQLDVFSWNTFLGGTGETAGFPIGQDDGTLIGSSRFLSDQTEASKITSSRLKAFMEMGYAIDWNGGSPADRSWVGAIARAKWYIEKLNTANRQVFDGFWSAAYSPYTGNGGQACVIGQGGAISPLGYLMMNAVRKLYGPRWTVTQNSAGLLTAACNPTATMASLMVVNYGKGAQNSKQVAFSRWPVNSTGNAQGTVWQLTTAAKTWGQDGTTANTQFTNGVSGVLNFPDPSVTIISVGS
jgi:hypothetical protein